MYSNSEYQGHEKVYKPSNLEDHNTLIKIQRYILSYNRGRNVQFCFMIVKMYKPSNLQGRSTNNL